MAVSGTREYITIGAAALGHLRLGTQVDREIGHPECVFLATLCSAQTGAGGICKVDKVEFEKGEMNWESSHQSVSRVINVKPSL